MSEVYRPLEVTMLIDFDCYRTDDILDDIKAQVDFMLREDYPGARLLEPPGARYG